MPDSPRWCARCEQYGDHHTDRCPKFAQAALVASSVCPLHRAPRSVCACSTAASAALVASGGTFLVTVREDGSVVWHPEARFSRDDDGVTASLPDGRSLWSPHSNDVPGHIHRAILAAWQEHAKASGQAGEPS